MARADHTAGEASERSTAGLLSTATNQLERALEHVDLEDEPQVADQIIEAIEATDDAAALASRTDTEPRQAEPIAR